MPRQKGPPLVRQAFAKELKGRRLAKGWTQMDLCRQAWGPKLGPTKRDLVSGYERGENVPGDDKLQALSRALGCRPEDWQFRREVTPSWALAMGDEPSMRAIGGGRAHLYVNQAVSMDVALKVMSLVTGQKRR